MKKCILIVSLFILASLNAQDLKKPFFEKKQNRIIAEYYHANGDISQKGYFNKDGKLEGIWISYDISGNKLSQGYYSNGKKTGQWLFWIEDTIKEVAFEDSKVIHVSEWRNESDVAMRMK